MFEMYGPYSEKNLKAHFPFGSRIRVHLWGIHQKPPCDNKSIYILTNRNRQTIGERRIDQFGTLIIQLFPKPSGHCQQTIFADRVGSICTEQVLRHISTIVYCHWGGPTHSPQLRQDISGPGDNSVTRSPRLRNRPPWSERFSVCPVDPLATGLM